MKTFVVPALFVIEALDESQADSIASDMCAYARHRAYVGRRASAFLDEEMNTAEIQPTDEGPYSILHVKQIKEQVKNIVNKGSHDFLSQALNEGDGVYRP